MAERYYRLVADEHADPDKILAITFTRKAAAEMKRRIVGRLREAGLSKQAQRAQVGPISTMHGFCERILREYPFDAGVDPQFELLSETAAAELRHECARVALSDLLSDEDVELAVRTFGGKSEWNIPSQEISQGLASIIDSVLADLRTAGRTPDELDAFCVSTQTVQDYWYDYCRAVLAAQLGSQYESTMLFNPSSAPKRRPRWLREADTDREQTAARVARGIAMLAAATWRRLLECFESRRQLDFSELEIRTCAMLEDRPTALSDKYGWILVDEAQDLNPLQHRILTALPAASVLHVGDPQQSIYGFRGAERKHFVEYIESSQSAQLRTNWRSTQGILSAVESVFSNIWQSEYMPMRTNSADEPDDPFSSKQLDDVEIWHVGDQEAAMLADGVRGLIDEGAKAMDIAVLMRDATQIDALVVRLGQYGIRAAVLGVGRSYFLRNEIRDLASALIALSDPYDDLAVAGLLRSPLVGVSLDGVFQVTLSAKGSHIIQTLRSTPLSESDARRVAKFLDWFEPLSLRSDQMSAWQVLAEVLASTDADSRFAMFPGKDGLVANARKLMSIALERRGVGAMEFGKWLASKQSLRSRVSDASSLSTDADAVKVCTMHGAKGLEWDIVVTLLNFKKPPRSKLTVVADYGIITLQQDGDDTLAFAAANSLHLEREAAEERRLLYVAMTRARRRLCVAIPQHGEYKGSPVVEDVKRALVPRGILQPGVLVRSVQDGVLRRIPSE